MPQCGPKKKKKKKKKEKRRKKTHSSWSVGCRQGPGARTGGKKDGVWRRKDGWGGGRVRVPAQVMGTWWSHSSGRKWSSGQERP